MNRILVGLFIALLVGTSLAYVLPSESDPLAEFIQPDGSLKFAGGQFTPELQRLLFGPKPKLYIEYAIWQVERGPYPTASLVSHTFTVPNLNIYAQSPAQPVPRIKPSDLLKPVVDAVRYMFSFDWLVGTASAADRFLVLDDAACTVTTIATDTDCWSTTSGGAGGASIPGTADVAFADASSGAGTGTQDAAMDVLGLTTTGFTGTWDTGNFALTIGTTGYTQAGTFTAGSSTITVSGNWDSSAGTFTYETSTTIFATTGTVTTPGAVSTRYFYNFTINASIVTTFTTPVGVANVLTVNGTLASSGGDAQRVFMVFGDAAAGTPVVIGVDGDLSQSGYFTYRVAGTYNVVGTTYQHLAVQGASGGIANLAGNVSTPLCGTYIDCAIILNGFQPSTVFTVNTNNYSMTAGGTLWLGDGGNFGVTFNAGSSAVSAYGVAPLGNFVIVNWQTATVTARPSSTVTNQCHYTAGTVEINFGTSTFNCYGQFRLSSGFIDAGSANINVIHDGACIPAPECGTDVSGAASPGEVVIFNGTYIIFGNSTWNMDSLWQNGNLSAQSNWDAGTATVTFHQTGINTDYNFGGVPLGEAEFYNVIFDFNGTVGDTAITFVVDSLWVANAMTVRDTTGGTTTVSTLGLGIDTGSLTVNNSGVLDASSSTVTTGSVTMTGGTSGTITVTTGTWTVSGNWNTSGAGSVYTQGTGIVTFDATATITLLSTDNTFDDLTISAGTVTLATAVVVTNALTISGGTFAKSTFAITSAGSLTMSDGDLTSTSGDVTITGAVNISSAASAIDFGSETWTVSGTWTNASTDGTVWEAGTGTVTFDSAIGGTMTFAGSNLSEAEFNNVTFTSSAGTAQTFTMATRGLRFGGTLSILDGTSTTTLATTDLGVTTGALSIGNGGILTANASTAAFTSVTMTGGTSGVITVTTGAWTVSGNWNTSGVGSTFTQGTSTVTMSGASLNINMLSTDNDYSTLIITGTITLLSDMDATTIQVNSGSFNVGTNDISFVTFETNVANGFVMDGITIVHTMTMTVNVGTILLTTWTSYTHGTSATDVQWTMNPSDAGAAITITLSNAQTDRDYELLRDSVVISTDSDRNATISFTVTDGWSPHSMQIVNVVVLPSGDGEKRPFINGISSWMLLLIVGLFLAALMYWGKRKR